MTDQILSFEVVNGLEAALQRFKTTKPVEIDERITIKTQTNLAIQMGDVIMIGVDNAPSDLMKPPYPIGPDTGSRWVNPAVVALGRRLQSLGEQRYLDQQTTILLDFNLAILVGKVMQIGVRHYNEVVPPALGKITRKLVALDDEEDPAYQEQAPRVRDPRPVA